MRIIRGSHRGKNIVAPANLPVRPTTDAAKESLFNVLNNYYDFDDIRVLDLFAGTGNISYEFSARGAKEVISVDIEEKCTNFMKKSAIVLGFDNMRIVRNDVFNFLRILKAEYDVVFADPPYDMDKVIEIPTLVFASKAVKDGGMLILEHSSAHDFSDHPNFKEMRHYGRVHFSFFVNV